MNHHKRSKAASRAGQSTSRRRESQPLVECLEGRQLLSSPAPDLTQSTAHLSVPRFDLVAAGAGNDALFAGGLFDFGSGPPGDAVDIYDTTTHQWSTGALPEPKVDLAAATLGDKAFFAGGINIDATSDAVDIFDASDHTWSVAHLSAARADLSATSVAGKALFAGGRDESVSNVVDIYDGATGHWSSAKLSIARYDMTAFTVGHLAIFAGGLTTTDGTSPTGSYFDVYDADTGVWSTSFLNGDAIIGEATMGSKAFVTVEPENATNSASSQTLTYDAVTNRWSTLTTPVGAGAVASVGNDVLFTDNSDVDTYNVSTGQWYSNNLSDGHALGAVVTVGNVAIFAGGEAPQNSSTTAVDIFTDTAPAAEISGGVVGHSKGRTTVTLSNTGDSTLPGNYTVQIYAIPPRQYHGAVLLGSQLVNSPLAAGDSLRFSTPISLASAPAGTYHLVAMVKAADGTLTPFAGATEDFTIGESVLATATVKPATVLPAATAAMLPSMTNTWLADDTSILTDG
jgi:hypothetical protein